jgi:hypothetical protein
MGLTRKELFSRIGLLRDVEPMTQAAYDFAIWLAQQTPDQGAAHSDPWHLSFHGSEFPGDNPYVCPRKALYRMMDIPRQPPKRWLMQVADAGKDIENRLVMTWYGAGYLLSPPPFDYLGRPNKQLQFQDSEHWLTSTVDSLVLHPRMNRPAPVEVKSKYADDIEEMLRLCRGPDPQHVNQLKCQIGLTHEQGKWEVARCYNSGRLAIHIAKAGNGRPVAVCPEHRTDKCLRIEMLEPVQFGYLYYVSRDDPADTWEFVYEYDSHFMEQGRKWLAIFRKYFLSNLLPQTNLEDKRFAHPFGWQWTKDEYPCKWCDYGDICREDTKAAIKLGRTIELNESCAVELAKEVRPDYDLDLVRAAVLRRWGAEELSSPAGAA